MLKATNVDVFVKKVPPGKMRQPALLHVLLCALFVGLTHTTAIAENKQPASTVEPVSADAAYIGPTACRECHSDKYEGFIQTAHHITSQLADTHSIAGNFAPDAAVMWTRDRNVWFEMSARDNGFYQTANLWEDKVL